MIFKGEFLWFAPREFGVFHLCINYEKIANTYISYRNKSIVFHECFYNMGFLRFLTHDR
jgi:hypothetical protein